jgi:hypothetical protein
VRADARAGTEHVITSKIKSKSTMSDLAAAHAAEAAASRKRLDEAKALAEQDEQAHREADERLRAVLSSRTSTGDDLAAAEAALRLTERRMSESAAAVAAASRALVNSETDLAEALVPFVADVVGLTPGVQAFVPLSPLPAPSVLLVQRTASRLDPRSGTLSGEVEVLLFREQFHRDLDAAAFERHAERHGGPQVNARPYGATEQDGTLVETVRLVVAGAFPRVPVVAPGHETSGLHNLAADLVQGVTSRLDRVALDTSRAVVSDSVSGGTRTVAVEVAVLGFPTTTGSSSVTFYGDTVRNDRSLDEIRDEIERAALALEDKAVGGLGRVASVTVKGAALVESAGIARPAGRVVFVGTTGGGVPVDGIELRVVFEVVSRLP